MKNETVKKKRLIIKDRKIKDLISKEERVSVRKDFFELLKRAVK